MCDLLLKKTTSSLLIVEMKFCLRLKCWEVLHIFLHASESESVTHYISLKSRTVSYWEFQMWFTFVDFL